MDNNDGVSMPGGYQINEVCRGYFKDNKDEHIQLNTKIDKILLTLFGVDGRDGMAYDVHELKFNVARHSMVVSLIVGALSSIITAIITTIIIKGIA